MSNRSINVGGNIVGGVQNTGDNVSVTQSHNQIHSEVSTQTLEIKQEVAALRDLLKELNTQDRGKIERALADAEEEIDKPEPDKTEVQGAIERVMGYVQKTEGFVDVMGKWVKHLSPIAVWLGLNIDKWLPMLAGAM